MIKEEYNKGLLTGLNIALETVENAKVNIEDEFDTETTLDKIILEEAQRGIQFAIDFLEMTISEAEEELEEAEFVEEEKKASKEVEKKFEELKKESIKIEGAEKIIHTDDTIVVKLADSSPEKEKGEEVAEKKTEEAPKGSYKGYSAYRIKGGKE